jgi:hypothetical protein
MFYLSWKTSQYKYLMLTKLDYTVDRDTLQLAVNSLPDIEFRSTINQPTGDFFYDPWELKQEFVGTVWDRILKTLPFSIGEARLIKLNGGECYKSHSDIDDRYHLNIVGKYAYLINLEDHSIHPQSNDGNWYEMDASPRHSAANFGNVTRIQLVVRKLLKVNKLKKPITVKIEYTGKSIDTGRFIFDDVISKWLSHANKRGIIDNFKTNSVNVEFAVDTAYFDELKQTLPENFIIKTL